MLAAGVKVGLGTDGVSAAGNLNLHRQVHIVAGLFKDSRMDPTLVGARVALRMATIDGARALGWNNEIGSLEIGKEADFVLFDLDHHEWTPYGDALQALVWSASPASIAQTWVAGRPLFEGGRITTLDDEGALRREARERAAAIVKRAGLDQSVPVETTLYD
jgi:5-methylthioadenosine/S-adenosylhomocysteine deaminase